MLFLIGASATVQAQQDKSQRKSPPAATSAKVNGVNVKIDYSQPSKKGRLIWGGLVKYNRVWRTGANEATTFAISADVKIDGELLKTGKYGLFTIPGKEEWTIIFNNVPDQWGSGGYKKSEDELRVTVKPSYGNPSVEKFTIEISKKGVVTMKWDDAIVSFTIS
ncbi:MAG: DUF2911 domain-containing protein [Bacteroidota bacterium]